MTEVGVFGKVPALGDFLSRGLPESFVDAWHGWLVRGLSAARAALGERFEPAYLAAPVWRFMLPAGAAGEARATGVLLPSVDAVGRVFPLTLAAVGAGLPAASALLAAGAWFEGLEAQGRAALGEGLDVEAWCAGVTGTGVPFGGGDGVGEWGCRPAEGDPAGAARDALADVTGGTMSVFWGDGSPFVAAGCLVGRGVPEDGAFGRLVADLASGAAA